MQENKVDINKYEEQYRKMKDDVETSKYASDDNFRNLLGTDNYIEKYLPFSIQTMIGETLQAFLSKKDISKLKDFEHLKYKELHKQVLLDKGIPNLPKKGYGKEGHKQVLTENREEPIGNSPYTKFMENLNVSQQSPKKLSSMNLENISEEVESFSKISEKQVEDQKKYSI